MALWSDWGAASWSEDLAAARDQAHAWTATTAGSKGWSDYWKGTVDVFIDAAYTAHDGWFQDDVTGFWSDLVAAMDGQTAALTAAGQSSALPANWSKLRDAFGSAINAASTTAAAREEGSVATVVGGTITESVEDVRTAVNPKKSALPWLLGLGLVLGIAFKVKS